MNWNTLLEKHSDISLYIHIPFCAAICHYCDFAKTANWDEAVVARYFKKLRRDLSLWTQYLRSEEMKLSTVFFGGGTPGLFTRQYEGLFEEFLPFLQDGAEVSMEANPDNVSKDALFYWKDLGVTRLSIGVQSFDEKILNFLVRDHSAADSVRALELAMTEIENVNLDLIYGIPGQSIGSFENDLCVTENLQIPHVSLYNLTFESGTPLGRAYHRGRIDPERIEHEGKFYDLARKHLRERGLDHEEVSNWSLPRFSCRHNWVYWQTKPYIAIGAGAHGFLKSSPSFKDIGVRYAFPRSDRVYAKTGECPELGRPGCEKVSFQKILTAQGAQIETRDEQSLLYEVVASSLRTKKGVPVAKLCRDLSLKFVPNDVLKSLESDGKLTIGDQAVFDPKSWFFENQYALAVIDSFHQGDWYQ